MNFYSSADTTTREPAPPRSSRRSRNRKIAIIGAVTAALLLPIAAWAAVQLFGFGTFTVTAADSADLTISGTPHTVGTLAPGKTVGIVATITNPNDYPVRVTGIAVKSSSLTVTPGVGHLLSQCHIHLVGGISSATGFPGSPAVPGRLFTPVGAPITIAAGASANVTVAGVIHQDSVATALCGVSGDYAVIGQVGS